MSCSQTLGGLPLDCGTSLGGIKRVYIAKYSDVGEIVPGADGIITSIPVTGDKFKAYNFRKQTGSMTSTLTVDETAGINYVSTEVVLVFTKMETAKRIEMSALALGKLAVIVEDSNGTFWYLGADDYVSASAGGGNTGTAKGDANSYTITLKDESKTFPYEVSAEAVEEAVEA